MSAGAHAASQATRDKAFDIMVEALGYVDHILSAEANGEFNGKARELMLAHAQRRAAGVLALVAGKSAPAVRDAA
jgi:hypothetical protein